MNINLEELIVQIRELAVHFGLNLITALAVLINWYLD